MSNRLCGAKCDIGTPLFDLLALVKCHPLYILFSSSQGAVFLINSRQAFFCCSHAYARQALSLTYGRSFAEFLGEPSLVRLALLELTTCVGLRYGFYKNNFREFSWKPALPNPAPSAEISIYRNFDISRSPCCARSSIRWEVPLKGVPGFS